MKGLKEKGTNVSQRIESQDTPSEPTIQEADGKDKSKETEDEEKGQWGGWRKDEDGAWMCLRLVEAVGDAVELGEGILDGNLLDNPPDGRTVGDVVVHASRHS